MSSPLTFPLLLILFYFIVWFILNLTHIIYNKLKQKLYSSSTSPSPSPLSSFGTSFSPFSSSNSSSSSTSSSFNSCLNSLTTKLSLLLFKSSNLLNNSWRFSFYSFPKNILEYNKIWIIGSSGVGKTTFLSLLGLNNFYFNNFNSTNGMVFYIDTNWKNTIFIDTEGFDQLNKNIDSLIYEKIILNYSKKTADCIIFVTLKMKRSDFNNLIHLVESNKMYQK